MADEPTDYSQAYDFLYRIERRITYLEKDAAFIEKNVAFLEDKRFKEFNEMTEDLKNLRLSMSSLKNNFSQCAHGMSRLSKYLKDAIKIEDIQTLNTTVDEIQFEEYVSEKDLKRGL